MKTADHCIFYVVRHGETEWNVRGIIQGQTDTPLTKTGIHQAHTLRETFKNIHFHAAFSSDLERAHHTATIAMHGRNLIIKKHSQLRERKFGKWEGRPHTIFRQELKKMTDEFLALSDQKKKTYVFPDMETDKEVTSRFINFLKEITTTHKGETVFVATHGSVMRSTFIHLGLGTYEEILPGAITNSAYAKIISDGKSFTIHETKGITVNKNVSLTHVD
jgi:broad specificity phosphatase PhoE